VLIRHYCFGGLHFFMPNLFCPFTSRSYVSTEIFRLMAILPHKQPIIFTLSFVNLSTCCPAATGILEMSTVVLYNEELSFKKQCND
jgi:hypothetical protein